MIDRINGEPSNCDSGEPVARESCAPPAAWYDDRITHDQGICGGQTVIRGTRIPALTIIASLAEGDSAEEIIRDFPTLTVQDILAAVAFANDKDGVKRRVILRKHEVNGFTAEESVLPGPPWRFTGPTEAEKLVGRPDSERPRLEDLVGTWPGDIDDGFEDWVRARREAARQKKWWPF